MFSFLGRVCKLSRLLIFCCHSPIWLRPVLPLLQYSYYPMVDSSSAFIFCWWVNFSVIVFWQNATGCMFTFTFYETNRSNARCFCLFLTYKLKVKGEDSSFRNPTFCCTYDFIQLYWNYFFKGRKLDHLLHLYVLYF